jgi:NO-binding membrane sensor protein with MHYT domain
MTSDHIHSMTGSYSTGFVILSVLIAALASYAALDLAGRVRSSAGTTRHGWLVGGATVMGLGIWSMHFIAMLAFHLPVPIAYDVPRVLISVAVAIGASLLALTVVSRASLRPVTLVTGGILMGGAIAGMHYIGMASMRVGAELTYRAPIVVLSIVIAIVASLAALWLAFSFRDVVSLRGKLLKVLSAMVMGVAIAGMHYTAMSAARFTPDQPIVWPGGLVLATDGLATAVAAGTLVITILALIGAVIDRTIESKVSYNRELVGWATELAHQAEESRRLSEEMEKMNTELQHSLDDAERARRQLAEEHRAYAALQEVAQQQTAKARWLEGVAETTTALAHEVNNPLTALMMNVDLLEDLGPEKASESIAEIMRSARRIATVINRLTSATDPRSVQYLGSGRMIDLSDSDPTESA